jgi:hypothetical protein
MLNRSAFNRSMLAGAAGAVALVFASASFTAEATVTSANSTVTRSGEATWSASLSPVFSSSQIHAAEGTWSSAGATTQFDGNRILAGVGNWTAEATLHAVILNTVFASGSWDGTSSLHMLPDAKLGNADWTAGATFTAVAGQSGDLSGDWSVDAQWALDEGLVTRGVEANWEAGAIGFHAEPTILSGGITTHDATVEWLGTASLTTDPELTDLRITELLFICESFWDAQASIIYGADAQWAAGSSTLGVTATKSAGGFGDWIAAATFDAEAIHIRDAGTVVLSASASMITHALQEHTGQVVWGGSAVFAADATVIHAANAAWNAEADMGGTGVREARSTVAMAGTASLAMESVRYAGASADWSAAGTYVMSGAAVLRLVQAPESRRYVMSDSQRQFVMSDSNRNFQFSGRSSNSEVST